MRSMVMKTAIGLISLGVAGGLLPAGVRGLEHLAPVLGGATGALVLLVAACVVAPGLAARAHRAWRVPGGARRVRAQRARPAPHVV